MNKAKERVHFRFYKEFVDSVFKYGCQIGIRDWSYKMDGNEYTAIVVFENNASIFFHSKHLKWLSDLSRVVNKVNKSRAKQNGNNKA